MRIESSARRCLGFTLLELMFVLIGVSALILFWSTFIPVGRRGHVKSSRIQCVSHLKQFGLAMRIWASDHQDQFPWRVSTNQGGTREWVGVAIAPHFQAISNELSTPKVLACPDDHGRLRKNSFTEPISETNISYFLGLEADETKPQAILSGDWRLLRVASPGLAKVTSTNQIEWGPDGHRDGGNIGLADGSVQQTSDAGVRKQFEGACRALNTNSLHFLSPGPPPMLPARVRWLPIIIFCAFASFLALILLKMRARDIAMAKRG